MLNLSFCLRWLWTLLSLGLWLRVDWREQDVLRNTSPPFSTLKDKKIKKKCSSDFLLLLLISCFFPKLGLDMNYIDCGVSWFSSVPRDKFRNSISVRPLSDPLKSFPIHYPLIISFGALQTRYCKSIEVTNKKDRNLKSVFVNRSSCSQYCGRLLCNWAWCYRFQVNISAKSLLFLVAVDSALVVYVFSQQWIRRQTISCRLTWYQESRWNGIYLEM